MTLIEAAKLTLEALESIPEDVEGYLPESCTDAVIALRTAIEAAEKQEPVTQCMEHGECFGGECIYATPPAAQKEPVAWAEEIIADLHACYDSEMIKENDSGDALIRLDAAICAVEEAAERHTAPPAAQWVGLTDEEKEQATGWSVEHIEQALKEKNT
jgi:hypothetical protein